jgi:hypothetical protein
MNRERILAISMLLVGMSAIAGGISLLAGFAPDTGMLDGSVFHNYIGPGLVLIGVVGGSALVASAALARANRHAPFLTVLAGVIMCNWIVTEWVTIGFHWLQVPYLVIGVLIAAAGWNLRPTVTHGSGQTSSTSSGTSGNALR